MSEKQDVKKIPYLKDTFKIGYDAFALSRQEAKHTWDLYHNRHYTSQQLLTLANRGQPSETFNVVKLFTRMLLGYYSTVINTIQANPVSPEDAITSSVLNDAIAYVLRDNNFVTEGEKVKLSAIIAGLSCVYVDVQPTGEEDEYGRPINKVVLEHVPEAEIVLDPMSRRDDYSDARYIHRFKWVNEEHLTQLFGEEAVDKLTQYYNFTNQPDADFTGQGQQLGLFSTQGGVFPQTGRNQEVGQYKVHNNYLIIHSVVKDSNGKVWSIYWNDDVILKTTELTHKEVQFPYRVVKTHTSTENEYYGIFREVTETQKAINQALIKLQLLVNTQKAFVEDGAVKNLADFTTAFNRVSGVISVQDLKGLRIENLARDALDQYTIIDKALDRVQRILSINDSFLGMAYASDSGRKVKLQQNASAIGLRYLTGRIEALYRFLGWDIANLIKQYYVAHQLMRITDDASGERWIELNKPLQTWTGNMDAQTNMPIMQTQYEEQLDPASGKPMVNERGNYVVAPITTEDTDISYTKVDIEIHSNNYNDEDEKNQLMLEQVLTGSVGQLLSQVNPSGFFKAASLSMKSMQTKNSPEIAKIFEQTAVQLQQNPAAHQAASAMAQGLPGQQAQQAQGPESGASSRTLNLPQNTNEPVI